MIGRSRAREVALQLLFQRDLNAEVHRADVLQFTQDRIRGPELREFCLSLYEGVTANLPEIDRRLAEAAENWRLPRMAAIDRNVLRLGAEELLFHPDTPPSVALDEAIELARRYGSADSPRFVNGVLDRLRLTKEQESAPPPAEPAAAGATEPSAPAAEGEAPTSD